MEHHSVCKMVSLLDVNKIIEFADDEVGIESDNDDAEDKDATPM